jgi:hypothetical protein
MLRLRSKTKKVSLQTNNVSFLLESNLKMEELSLTTTFKRNQPSTWFLDSEVACKSSSRLSLVRPSPLRSSQQTLLRTSKLKFKIKKVFLQINNVSFSLESNLKMEEHFLTTIFKKNQPSTWFLDLEVVCKSSSRP